ncbi:MAG: Membrane-associated sulfatase family enzyme [Candidatus Uhrbacteria bacterium GW2011_GWF2_39_13]|uniref:Membrane-associated sulfatase family enzyme n=1 Tax=Candidatus Uhrbacteria bacterium GW2011_GWF2_39_13 TaxID=1618995 RepID=A0A0G0MTV6_9BACT|nr:MAG: Membrane-associated sulfatase family enzyme [Candidatus Uhrbacteria bacterium GW2011_GWF2_39_13]
MNFILNIIKKIYCQKLEDFCVRLLYFFNTIDTYFIVSGFLTYLFLSYNREVSPLILFPVLILAITAAFISDFYPWFVIFSLPLIVLNAIGIDMPLNDIYVLLVLNIIVFFTIQFGLMGLPDSIVARDIKVAFIKMYNSLFTIAPTTVSFVMSVFFGFFLAFSLNSANYCKDKSDYAVLASFWILILVSAFITRYLRPKNHFTKFHKPDIPEKPLFKRVLLLNIDGARKDIFDKLVLPCVRKIMTEGSYHPKGLETVYRALTNPAFASIYTGTIPEIHGVKDNNFGQSIRTEGLPDIVPTISYGSMHVQHFNKKYWETKIVSLPEHSVYKSDDIMVEWLKKDLLERNEVRLFIADFSEADFIAHAYGSTSKSYKDALERIDGRIGGIIDWMRKEKLADETAVIICSDHGISAIDHSYLIAESEKYVPFIMWGKGIKKGFEITRPGKIMDICCTISYLLGMRYPLDCRGQVFTEALENHDREMETDNFVSRFNSLSYEATAEDYAKERVEIYHGDSAWWQDCLKKHVTAPDEGLTILDIGCGRGFVADIFLSSGLKIKRFVCMDISNEILDCCKKKFGTNETFEFTDTLTNLNGKFDVIAVSSVFHHLHRPEKLATRIDELLNSNGFVIGSHEPDKTPFLKLLFRHAATLYKMIGGGISINNSAVEEFNRLLKTKYPAACPVCREEILQMVEYHSPVEQYDSYVDAESGFIPHEFFRKVFSGYDIILLENYTTFFHRPLLEKHKIIQNVLKLGFKVFSGKGNLFRYLIRKH